MMIMMKSSSVKLYHGSTEIVQYPDIRIAKFNKDFYFGFYCTKIENQAIRWATRYKGKGIVNEYLYRKNDTLKVLEFIGGIEVNA